MLSIIIIVRNEEKNIIHLLNSIEKQKQYCNEIIIIDEHSKDNTMKSIEPYLDKLPIRFFIGSLKPIGFNRNLGGYAAKGNILLFTEGNCFFKQGFLKKINNFFRDESLVAWIASSIPYHSSWYIYVFYKIYDVFRYLLSKMFLGFSVSGSLLAVRKNLFNKLGGFDTSINLNDDGKFGRKIHDYCMKNKKYRYVFSLNEENAILRSISRFDTSFLESLDHFIYILCNFIPPLNHLLKNKMLVDGYKFYNEEKIT